MSSEIRIDRAALPRVTKNDSGFLRGEAFVTRTGVFKYINADGSERYELRHPDDILTPAHLDSLKSLPITVDHPIELVNAGNSAALSKGMTGETVSVDGENIGVTLTITHSDAIAEIESRKRQELSLGYSVELIKEDGVYEGQAYTHRQTNPRANHLAIVPRARAGAQARINLDGAAVQSCDTYDEEVIMTDIKLATVALDSGLEYQAAPEVAKALEKLRADAAAHADAVSAVQAKLDAAEEAKAEMQAKLDGEAERFADAVKSRIALAEAARKIAPEVNLDGSDVELMTAAIKAVKPALNLDGKSDAYIQARFDAAVEDMPKPVDGQMKVATVKADAAPVKLSGLDIARGQWKKGESK